MEILVGALLVTQAGTIIILLWLWTHIKRLYRMINLQAEGSGNLTRLVSELVQMLAPTKPPKPKPEGKVIPWKDNPA